MKVQEIFEIKKTALKKKPNSKLPTDFFDVAKQHMTDHHKLYEKLKL